MAQSAWYQKLYGLRDGIPHGTTARYTLQLTDETGAAISLSQLTTVELTIYDLDASPPVVLIDPRDVKNVPANGGAVSSSGLLTLTLSSVDNAMSNPSRDFEQRRWAIRWTHSNGAKTQYAAVDRLLVKTF